MARLMGTATTSSRLVASTCSAPGLPVSQSVVDTKPFSGLPSTSILLTGTSPPHTACTPSAKPLVRRSGASPAVRFCANSTSMPSQFHVSSAYKPVLTPARAPDT